MTAPYQFFAKTTPYFVHYLSDRKDQAKDKNDVILPIHNVNFCATLCSGDDTALCGDTP